MWYDCIIRHTDPYRAAIEHTIMVMMVIIERRRTIVRKNTEPKIIQHNIQMMMIIMTNTTNGTHTSFDRRPSAYNLRIQSNPFVPQTASTVPRLNVL